MSQHDMVLDNASGATLRADVNSALQALASSSKGPSAPSTIYAGQMWLDDDTPSGTIWTLNMYDGSNSISVGHLDTANNWFIPTLGAGSASLPSLVFTGDLNTGFLSPGADIIAASTGGSERLRVTAAGNVIVGGTAIVWDETFNVRGTGSNVMGGFYSSSASYTSAVVRAQAETTAGTGWRLFEGRASGGGIQFVVFGNGDVQNTNNSYGAISDARLKENITDARSYVDDLMRVKIRKYSLKSERRQQANQLGVLAQELVDVFPGLVNEVAVRDAKGRLTGDTVFGVNYSILSLITTEVVQEQQRMIEALSARVAALEAK